MIDSSGRPLAKEVQNKSTWFFENTIAVWFIVARGDFCPISPFADRPPSLWDFDYRTHKSESFSVLGFLAQSSDKSELLLLTSPHILQVLRRQLKKIHSQIFWSSYQANFSVPKPFSLIQLWLETAAVKCLQPPSFCRERDIDQFPH